MKNGVPGPWLFRAVALLLPLAASCETGTSGESPPTINPRLKDAPPNTWVRLAEEQTGARAWPMFHFDPAGGRFVTSGGVPKGPAHFDTETFDPAEGRWRNAYPAGAPYGNESGPSDAPGVPFRENELPLKADANGVVRLVRGLNPYVWDPGFFHQSARCPADGKFYAYLFDATIRLDPATWRWEDLKVPRFSKGRNSWLLYGSMAWDPVNGELVFIGGTSDEPGGTPGTWTFAPAAGQWKRLASGSAAMRGLGVEAEAARAAAAAFVNACRNRFYLTESDAESKQDLAGRGAEVSATVEKLLAAIRGAALEGRERRAAAVAGETIGMVAAALRKLAAEIRGGVSAGALVEGEAAVALVERACMALDVEPRGRAASPAVTCFGRDRIVLFGGCRFDGYLADTWVYDCRARSWEQRWPKLSPAPRAGHIMAWLPKSGRVVLYGATPFHAGYNIPHGNARPPQDLWAYDVDADEWKLLALPSKDSPLDARGDADSNDILVAIGSDPRKAESRVTWGMRVDPGVPDAGREKAGVPPGTVARVFDTPSDYDRAAKPDPDAVAKLLRDLPPNRWTAMPKPPKPPNSHPWGTCLYDTARRQWISFGGGHSGAHFNDVAHYGVRTAAWSCGYGEEYPYANASFRAFFNQTFRNRPTVPTHLWDAAAFDPPSGKCVYCIRGATWVYDPARREWEYPPAPPPCQAGELNCALADTPKGAVCWASGALYLFDAAAGKWDKLPLSGESPGQAYGDTGGICYDSKRDCLWLAHNGSPMLRYDMKTGRMEKHAAPGVPENIW
ncbi:MAG: kelch motif-containing protein, partial [Planctomycetota bacterium]|nr:kelch motif-containing protein [Planctomycetota bacterium]